MAFEKLNYTTEEKIDEESIQDKIDKGELDVMKLTRDNLQKLKVDILESSSYVKIRDHDGKIIGDLKDNNVVDFNGENISIDYKGKKKVFLGINFADGKTGYVSADYLKGEKIDSTSQISDNNGGKAEKTKKPNNKPQVLDTKKNGGEKGNEGNKKVEGTKKTDKVEATDTKESNNSSPITLGYTKDGKNYIIGENGEAQLLTYEKLSPEYKKALEGYKLLLPLIENLNLLLTAIVEKNPENAKYQKELQDSINKFNPNVLELSVKNTENTVINIYKSLNIYNVDTSNYSNILDLDIYDRISILTYIRDELDNYELVRKEIVESNFNKVTKLTEEQIQKLIKNPTLTNKEIEDAIGKEEMKEIQDKLIEKKSEAEKYFLNYKDELKSQYPNLSENEIQDIVLNAFMGTVAKTYIMESYISQHESTSINGYNGKDTEIELFSDIQGIGTFDLSDKNWDLGYEAFKMIATEALALAVGALTAGAGALGVNALVYGARGFKGLEYLQKTASLASKSIEGLSAVEKSSVIGAKFARFAALSTVEGSAFYVGYGAVQSGAEGKNMYSGEGLAESIAFMGAFKGLNGLYKALGKELQVGVPLSQQKILLTSQLLAEGTTFSALGLGFDGKLLEPGEWTAETIVQAFLMAGLFKAGGRMMENMRIKRSGENDVVIEEVTYPVEFYKNKTTGETYTKSLDGGFFNSKGEIIYKDGVDIIGDRVVDKDFLSKIEKVESTKNVENKEIEEVKGNNETISINNVNYPKNAEFIVKREDGVDFNFKTGENGEILEITQGNGKMKVKKENYKEILENCNSKNIKFYTNGSGQLVYEIDGKLYKSDGTKSYSKRENLKEVKTEEEVKSETKVEENATNETISDIEYSEYVNTGKVSNDRLNNIVEKYLKDKDSLSPREREIFMNNAGEINKIMSAKHNKEKTVENEEKVSEEKVDFENGIEIGSKIEVTTENGTFTFEKLVSGDYKCIGEKISSGKYVFNDKVGKLSLNKDGKLEMTTSDGNKLLSSEVKSIDLIKTEKVAEEKAQEENNKVENSEKGKEQQKNGTEQVGKEKEEIKEKEKKQKAEFKQEDYDKIDKSLSNDKTNIKDIFKKWGINPIKWTVGKGIDIGKWIGNKTVGDIWNEIKSGKNNYSGGKVPFDIARTIFISGKSGEWNLKGVAGRTALAGGLSYLDSSDGNIETNDFAQNYYEILLFNRLGIVFFESDKITDASAEGITYFYNAFKKTNLEPEEIFIPRILKKLSEFAGKKMDKFTDGYIEPFVDKGINYVDDGVDNLTKK